MIVEKNHSKTDSSTLNFLSTSKRCKIHACIWHPDKTKYAKPIGIIQIAHGMVDHIERFEDMALYFTKRGFLVVGNDHLGHGDSIASKDDWGYFADHKDCGTYLVKDMHKLTKIIKKEYPNLPYVLIGHSMGSFLTRKYMMMYKDELDACVVLGTGNQRLIIVEAGRLLVHITKYLKGDKYRSPILKKLMFANYNKYIKDCKSENAWLTRDDEIVKKYDHDEKCSFMFTVNAYEGMLKVIRFVIRDANIRHTPRYLPVLFAAGTADPVGEYGKAVKRIYRKYARWLDDAELKLYDDCRHELHSEIDREHIFEDIYLWILKKINI